MRFSWNIVSVWLWFGVTIAKSQNVVNLSHVPESTLKAVMSMIDGGAELSDVPKEPLSQTEERRAFKELLNKWTGFIEVAKPLATPTGSVRSVNTDQDRWYSGNGNTNSNNANSDKDNDKDKDRGVEVHENYYYPDLGYYARHGSPGSFKKRKTTTTTTTTTQAPEEAPIDTNDGFQEQEAEKIPSKIV